MILTLSTRVLLVHLTSSDVVPIISFRGSRDILLHHPRPPRIRTGDGITSVHSKREPSTVIRFWGHTPWFHLTLDMVPLIFNMCASITISPHRMDFFNGNLACTTHNNKGHCIRTLCRGHVISVTLSRMTCVRTRQWFWETVICTTVDRPLNSPTENRCWDGKPGGWPIRH
jgi:hypothetical protein